MSDFVPPEIIRELLIRLPVKSLLRFRSVSKPWRSLIDSEQFTKLHLQNSYKTDSNRTLVVHSTEFFYVDLDSFKLLKTGDHNNKFKPQRVSCSCNGLILLVFDSNTLLLWNPATRKSNKLPKTPPLENVKGQVMIRGQYFSLGYDSKHDDYKVVRVVQTNAMTDRRFLSSETMIYSLRLNTWKGVKGFPYMLPLDRKWGVYLNDALHTLVKNGDGKRAEETIMAFDIAKEEHYEVPKPSMSRSRSLTSVEVLGGKFLSAIVSGKKNGIEVWVMKDYGVKDSWSKIFTFQPPCSDPCLNLVPLAYSKRGDEVLFNYEGMCLNWYNLRKKTVMIACVPGLTASFNASAYDPVFDAQFCVGSLVSPCSPAAVGAGDGGQQGNKGKKILKKKRDEFLSAGFKLKL